MPNMFFFPTIFRANLKEEKVMFRRKLVRKQKSFSQGEALRSGAKWARTTDSRIFSPMLYQLSYSTALGCAKVYKFILVTNKY